MTLYRQSSVGDWGSVFCRVATDLQVMREAHGLGLGSRAGSVCGPRISRVGDRQKSGFAKLPQQKRKDVDNALPGLCSRAPLAVTSLIFQA